MLPIILADKYQFGAGDISPYAIIFNDSFIDRKPLWGINVISQHKYAEHFCLFSKGIEKSFKISCDFLDGHSQNAPNSYLT